MTRVYSVKEFKFGNNSLSVFKKINLETQKFILLSRLAVPVASTGASTWQRDSLNSLGSVTP